MYYVPSKIHVGPVQLWEYIIFNTVYLKPEIYVHVELVSLAIDFSRGKHTKYACMVMFSLSFPVINELYFITHSKLHVIYFLPFQSC